MRISTSSGVLVLFGPAQFICDHAPVRLRTKGLALLYVLALDGPMLRERLVDLLWDRGDAQGNLRVELHRLRVALGRRGIDAFPSGQDPLRLPEGITLDRMNRHGDPDALQGLDDLSPSFQIWLETQRGAVEADQEKLHAPLREEQVEEVARQVRPPYVIVLRGPPGSGRHTFVRALAERIGMPLVRDLRASGSVLHEVDGSAPESKKVAEHIERQPAGVWAVRQSCFGRDGELLLRLRNDFPAERLRFLDLDAIPWSEARPLLLSRLAFDEAARLYVATGGNLDYLRELVRLRPPVGFGPDLPLPQRVRAAFLLEANGLPDATHAVLDLLALHPGTLSEALVERLDVAEHLDDLESAGWLRFDTDWTFTYETARRVIAGTVLAGRRAHDHRRLADAFAAIGPAASVAAAYHQVAAGHDVAPEPPGALEAWANALLDPRPPADCHDRPEPTPAPLGNELAILLDGHQGLHDSDEPGWSHWVRRPQAPGPSLADHALPDEHCVVHITMRAFAESAFGVGFGGDAFPLRLWFRGGPSSHRRVIFVPDAGDALLHDGTLLLSYRSSRDVSFVVHHRALRVETQAEAGVVEFQLRAWALARSSTRTVPAYDLLATVSEARPRS
jgi:hypothetical protein